jgi:hypothetical protein
MLEYRIISSNGYNIYKVRFEGKGETLKVYCTCPAGKRGGKFCKHISGLLNKDTANIVEPSDKIEALDDVLPGSSLLSRNEDFTSKRKKETGTHRSTEISAESKQLEEIIQKYQESYYSGEAEVSDSEFDLLWDKLKKLSPKHPLLTRIEKPDSMIKNEELYREWEREELEKELLENETEEGRRQIVFIEYEDANGSISDRIIKIEKVYIKDEKLFLFAYCFLRMGIKSFRVDRILSMEHSCTGTKIKDIEGFLEQEIKTKTSVEDLAVSALNGNQS